MLTASLPEVVQTALRTSDFRPVAEFIPGLRLQSGEETAPEVVALHERTVDALAALKIPAAQRAAADLLDLFGATGRTPAGKSESLINLVLLLS